MHALWSLLDAIAVPVHFYVYSFVEVVKCLAERALLRLDLLGVKGEGIVVPVITGEHRSGSFHVRRIIIVRAKRPVRLRGVAEDILKKFSTRAVAPEIELADAVSDGGDQLQLHIIAVGRAVALAVPRYTRPLGVHLLPHNPIGVNSVRVAESYKRSVGKGRSHTLEIVRNDCGKSSISLSNFHSHITPLIVLTASLMRGQDNRTRVTLAERGWSDRLHESACTQACVISERTR